MKTVDRFMLPFVLLVPAVFGGALKHAHADELIAWRNVPIPIVLNVGEERVLAFPDNVEVGVPEHLNDGLFRTQSTGGTALWLARQPFAAERVQVRLIGTGHVMLFDVTAVDVPPVAPSEPMRIVFPEALTGDGAADAGGASGLTPVTLTRFAAQQLYAPERLLRDLAGVRRVPMGVPRAIELYRGEPLRAEPLASWQGGAYYVTAVKLTHLGRDRVVLDPRILRGRFVAATFQHGSLGSWLSPSDTTVVYLVTDVPFAAAIASAIPPLANESED